MSEDRRVPPVQVVAPSPALRAGLAALLGAEEAAASPEGLPPTEARVVVLAGGAWQQDVAALAEDDTVAGLILLTEDAPQAGRALHALNLPAWAILPPAASADQLHAAVAAVAAGLVVVPPDAWPSNQGVQLAGGELPEPLTSREREVLQLLAEGLSNKLVARRLRISEHTVKFHVSSIYAKLGAANRTEAVSHAARAGLVIL
ncbi:MAG: response regulator transcription factor [Chloroflexi bacterium]|nr:response regulator transcription factor [Chloroflexota bacterium]